MDNTKLEALIAAAVKELAPLCAAFKEEGMGGPAAMTYGEAWDKHTRLIMREIGLTSALEMAVKTCKSNKAMRRGEIRKMGGTYYQKID